MRAPRVFTHQGVLIQVYFASLVFGTAAVALSEPHSITREVVLAAGPNGWWLLYFMMACAGWLVLDWLLCIEWGCRGKFCYLSRWRGWAGIGMAFGWVAQAFVAFHEMHAPGFVTLYTINALCICIAAVIDARRRPEKYAAKPKV